MILNNTDPVIDWLDSSRTLVSKRFFRDSCKTHNGHFLKDLSLVEKDLSQVCLVDNATISFTLCEGFLLLLK
jgi:CTD nuclear envelope phosphatase 1